jgi:hypothetical protein
MADLRTLGATSNRVRFTLKDKTTGQGKTGLSISTTGLVISTIADNEASATAYTVAGSTIETIATLGTFATPTATKCRFKEVDATNNKGLYEFQFANARFAVTGAKRLVISVNDAESTILDADYEIEFTNDLVASIWDETNTGATHNINSSTGKQLRSITSGTTDAIYPLSGTVNLTAATSTTATLDASASTVSQAYQWDVLNILTGTGAGQSRIITNYTTGRVATVTPAWTTTPDTSSTFDVTPTASVQVVSYVAGQDPATLVWAAATRTITGGTVTTLTNLPNPPANWLTATGIAANALNGKGDWLLASSYTAAPTAAAVATAVWTDTTAGDFTTLTSPGKIIFSQLGGAFTTTSSSVFSTASLANAPTGGTGGTVDANIVSVLGNTAVATQQGLLDVRLAEIDGTSTPVAHAGTPGSALATLSLRLLSIVGSDGAAPLDIQNTGSGLAMQVKSAMSSGSPAIFVQGNGGSDGAISISGIASTGILINGELGGIRLASGTQPGLDIVSDSSSGVRVTANAAGQKALLLAGDASTDSFAIAAGAGSPIDVFDASGRVTGSATLLDATPVTDPGGVASTFPQMVVQVWRYLFKRKTKAVSGLTIKTYADDNTTVNTQQSYTDDGAGNQSQGPAT